MPTYRFQLESLQKLRQSHRNQLRMRVAEVVAAQEQLDERSEWIRGELMEMQAHRRAALTNQEVDVNTLLNQQRYEMVLAGQLATLQEQAGVLAAEADRRREALAEAEQQVRVLEKLDGRRRAEFEQTERRREEVRLSEIACRKFYREQLKA